VIEVVGMVYRSTAFLNFLDHQSVCHRIVANNPERSLMLDYDIDIYMDPNPEDHYLSRVYRCWNYCVESSSAEYVCLVNSDMAFSPGWLEALERRLDGHTLPCSRLVEPGIIRPGEHAIEIDIGRDPRTFPWVSWNALANDLREERTEPGGLFMPCVLHRETFLRVGGYTGNLTLPVGGNDHPHGHYFYRGGKVAGQIVSGDADLFWRMSKEGFKHVTCFDSLVYHMQEGETRHIE